MRAEQTLLHDCYIIHDHLISDDRGFFFESFNEKKFADATGLHVHFVQDNQSRSKKGVLRGLHYQKGHHSQAKLVRVLRGKVIDVAVDLRKSSPTFGQTYSIELTDTSNTQLFIPRGFAHGFVVLSDTADFFYKCDNFYNKEADGGIIYNDAHLNIDWKLPATQLLISEKDALLPAFDINETIFE